uniref:(northern house mosquito) hypothetical protein n=1 Tax=Culex pipiens TaxID=7175 RepID=A0A8D8IGN8_CULPI
MPPSGTGHSLRGSKSYRSRFRMEFCPTRQTFVLPSTPSSSPNPRKTPAAEVHISWRSPPTVVWRALFQRFPQCRHCSESFHQPPHRMLDPAAAPPLIQLTQLSTTWTC